MKAYLKSITKIAAMFLFIVVMLCHSANIFAAGNNEKIHQSLGDKKYSKAVTNLIKGIKSDNLGLKRSSIYYAGLYEIPEAVDVLIRQMKNESDSDTRILIALSLYKIGDVKGYSFIKTLSEEDNDVKLRNMCRNISREFNDVINSNIMKINKTNY